MKAINCKKKKKTKPSEKDLHGGDIVLWKSVFTVARQKTCFAHSPGQKKRGVERNMRLKKICFIKFIKLSRLS